MTVSEPVVSSTFRYHGVKSPSDGTPTPGNMTAGSGTETAVKTLTRTTSGYMKTYEMPEGEALAFASAEFRNTLESDTLRVVAPRFVVVHEDQMYQELLHIEHPTLGAIEKNSLGRVSEVDSRWGANMFGIGLDPDETYATTLVFRVPAKTNPDDDSVVFHPTLKTDPDRIGNSAVEWH